MKEREIAKLMDRLSKDRERATKYRKKIMEQQKDASKKSATLLLVTSENENLIKKIAMVKLQMEQHEAQLHSKDNKLKSLADVNS